WMWRAWQPASLRRPLASTDRTRRSARRFTRQIPPKDHPPRARLKHARHGNSHFLVDVVAPPFDHDHRPVVEIADPLPDFLSRLDQPHGEALPRQVNRLERGGNVVWIDPPTLVAPGPLC